MTLLARISGAQISIHPSVYLRTDLDAGSDQLPYAMSLQNRFMNSIIGNSSENVKDTFPDILASQNPVRYLRNALGLCAVCGYDASLGAILLSFLELADAQTRIQKLDNAL
jgi:hypothetical protein